MAAQDLLGEAAWQRLGRGCAPRTPAAELRDALLAAHAQPHWH